MRLLLMMVLMGVAFVSSAQNPNFDEDLAKRLGADAYGMKNYFLVILKTGPTVSTDDEFIGKCFRGHMDNINRMAKDGQLVVAGPFSKNEQEYKGIFILHNIATLEDVKEVLQKDPAISNGILDYEIFGWYGSAALPEYLPIHDKISKIKP